MGHNFEKSRKSTLDKIATDSNIVLDNTAEIALASFIGSTGEEREERLSDVAFQSLKKQTLENKDLATEEQLPKEDISLNNQAESVFDDHLDKNGDLMNPESLSKIKIHRLNFKKQELFNIKKELDEIMIWEPVDSQKKLDTLEDIYKDRDNQVDSMKERITELSEQKEIFEKDSDRLFEKAKLLITEIKDISRELKHNKTSLN